MRSTHSALMVAFAVVLNVAVGPAHAAEPSVPLVEAVKQGDIELVRTMLRQQVDVNLAQADGTTAVHWAADLNQVAMLDLLIKARGNVRLANRYGATPFLLACRKGNTAIIERLLTAGENANTVFAGEHVLMMAARAGNPDAVRVLVRAGADVNYQEPERKQTALMWAAAAGRADVIEVLLESGAKLTLRSSSPPLPSAPAIPRINDPLGLRAYRDPSYSVNWDGMEFTALLFAARGGQLEATRALLDGGADVNEAKTDDGTTALILAVANRHWEVAGLLLDRGADPNRGPGYTALHQVAWSRRLNANSPTGYKTPPEPTGTLSSLDLAKKVVASGVNINARMTRSFRDGYRNRMNRIGATAFLLSSKLVDLPLVRLLLASGADIRILNEDADTPLMLAAGVSLHNPNEDAGTEKETHETVRFLLDLGFDVNAVNNNHETAMHGASYRGYKSVTTLLYERGAKLDIKNILGWTPVRVADGIFYSGFFKAQPDVATLLRDYYHKEGLPVPPPPAGNDTSVLTLSTEQDKGRLESATGLRKAGQEPSNASSK